MSAYAEVRSAGATPDLVVGIVWLALSVARLARGDWTVALIEFAVAVAHLRIVALTVTLDLTRKYALKGWVR